MRIAQRAAAAVLVGAAVTTGAVATAVPTQARQPTSHLARAHAAWVKGDRVAAAVEGRYWRTARKQLAHYGPRYRDERAALTSLIAIPLTDTTRRQRADATRLTRALNAFFDTPGRYGVSSDADPKATARTQWLTAFRVPAAEQDRYLEAAIKALSKDVRRYGQQATQLAELAAIPLTDTTAKQRETAVRVVASLNDFFGTDVG